jgi:hypothetical protein
MKWLHSLLEKLKTSQATSARQAMQEEWFNDYYLRRRDVYKMNFFRGIFFGFGSVIGGTVVLAIVLWILSLFVDFPLIGDLLKGVENSLSQPR